MKRKLFAVGLSAFAALAIVGSGFATWFFNTGTIAEGNANITTEVTPGSEKAGTITAPTALFKLELDQGTYAQASNPAVGITAKISTNSGQSWTDAAADDFKATIATLEADRTNWAGAGVTATFVATVELGANFANYVAFDDTQMNDTKEGTSTATNIVYKKVINADTVDFTLDITQAFSYTENKPTTLSAYNNMKTSLGKDVASFKVTYSVVFTDDNSANAEIE